MQPWRPGNRALTVAALYAMAAVVMFVASVVYSLAQPESYDPITFETQTVVMVGEDGIGVIPKVDGVAGPAVMVGDPVPVRSRVCSSETFPVTVTGYTEWSQIEPPGYRHETNRGVASIAPACTTRQFENPMPREVIDRVEAQAARGVYQTKWRLDGEVIPEHPDGVTSTWTTETFTIVAGGT